MNIRSKVTMIAGFMLLFFSQDVFIAEVPGAETDPTRRPFSTTSPWNTPIPSTAIYRDNADIRKTTGAWVSNGAYGIALYVTNPSKSPVTVSYGGGYNVIPGGTVTLRVGTDIQPPFGTDGTVTILDPINGKSYDFWQFQGTGATRSALRGVPHPLNGPGMGNPSAGGPGVPGPAGIRAAWTSGAAGILRGWHFAAGAEINHALACSVMNSQLRSGPVYPVAVAQDAGGAWEYAGTIPMGTRLAIPRNVNLATLGLKSDIGLKIARAAQTYGIYVVDRHHGDTSMNLFATPTEVSEAQLIPLREWWSGNTDLIKIRDALRIVEWSWTGSEPALIPPSNLKFRIETAISLISK